MASAAASCIAVAVALGVLRRLVTVVDDGHGAADHGLPLDAGGISVGAQLADFELSEPVRASSTDVPTSISFFGLLTVPRIVILTRHGCSGCEKLIKALNDSPTPMSWMNIVVVIDPESPVAGLVESTMRRGVRFLVQHGSVASIAFQHRASPHTFAVIPSGIVVDKVMTDDVATLAGLAADALQLRPPTSGQPSALKLTVQAQPGREVIR